MSNRNIEFRPYPGQEALAKMWGKPGAQIRHALDKAYIRQNCSRCGGTGQYNGGHWGGKCYGCGGSGRGKEVRVDEAAWNVNEKRRVASAIRAIERAEKIKAEQAIKSAEAREANAPVIAVLSEAVKTYPNNELLQDLNSKAQHYRLSPAQVQLVADVIKREEEKAAFAAQAKMAKAGRYEITGKVLFTKESQFAVGYNRYAYTLKMCIQDIDGAKWYGSVPSNLQVKKDDVVKLTATVQPKEPGFSFFSRPTKATITQMGAESQRINDALEVKKDCAQAAEKETKVECGSTQQGSAPSHHYDENGRYNPPDYL